MRRRYAARAASRGVGPVQWVSTGNLSVATPVIGHGGPPLVAKSDGTLVVGRARLDNRDEIAAANGVDAAGASDLELVLHTVARSGTAHVGNLVGDFAFVAVDRASGDIVAVRDPFGVKPLFYTRTATEIAFASHPSILSDADALNPEYVAHFLVATVPPNESTIYPNINAVPSGATVLCRAGAVVIEPFWSADDFDFDYTIDVQTSIETFQTLFARAVELRLSSSGPTWAHLSGGLDSSSVVAMAQRLAQLGTVSEGLAGTLTIVDHTADGDERHYSDIVLAATGLKNQQVAGYWHWQNDGSPPPLTEEPSSVYTLWALERRLYAELRKTEVGVLLSGLGADHYLTGNLYYIADWLAQGRFADAFRELARWSSLARTSFWRLAAQNALTPLLPAGMTLLGPRSSQWAVPAWINPQFARAVSIRAKMRGAGLTRPSLEKRDASTRPRSRFLANIASAMRGFGTYLERPITNVQHAYPFLYRPLVEFSLRLPPGLRAQPFARKWILREAMRGILPEEIRTRTTKGGTTGRFQWSLLRERARVDDILRDPILGQMGYIDVDELRKGVEAARSNQCEAVNAVMCALSLETWLRVRSGRWHAMGPVHQ